MNISSGNGEIKQPVVKFSSKKIEFAKWFVGIWFTLTIALLSFAVSWGFNLATINQIKILTNKHEVMLHGSYGNSGLVGDVKTIKNDMMWIKNAVGEMQIQLESVKEMQRQNKQ